MIDPLRAWAFLFGVGLGILFLLLLLASCVLGVEPYQEDYIRMKNKEAER